MKRSVWSLLTLSVIAVSFSSIFVKWSDAPPTISSMYRMYVSCILLLPMVWMKREAFRKFTMKEWIFLPLAGIFLAFHFALWFGSLKFTTVASSTIVLSLQPIVALAGGYLIYKERAGVSTFVTIAISIVGVLLVGWGDFGLSSKSALIGDALSFLSVIAVVGYLLIGQNNVKKINHWVYSFCVFFFAGLALYLYNLAAGVPIGGYDTREWGIFLLLAIVPTTAHIIFNMLLNVINTTTISMSILGEPVGATILAVIILGEQVTGLQIIGGITVLLGVFLFLLQQNRTYRLNQETTQ